MNDKSHYVESDRLVFEAEGRRCEKLLGLTEWDITYLLEPIPPDLAAQVRWNRSSRKVAISLQSRPGLPASERSGTAVKRHARHEIMELVLHRLGLWAEEAVAEHRVDAERHAVIDRLLLLLA